MDRGELAHGTKVIRCARQVSGPGLWENDAINHMDDTIAGWDVSRDDVGGAAVRVGKNAATLIEETSLQGADAIRSEHDG